MSSVLVVSPDRVGERMAGPAIRAYEIATALGARHEVTLAAPPGSALPAEDASISFAEVGPGSRAFLELARRHAVVVAQFLPGSVLARLHSSPARIVVDLYDPRPLEVLERFGAAGAGTQRRRAGAEAAEALAYLASADFVICASERQRDLWIGGLMTAGLIDPERYAADPSYRSFVDVVPFGVPDQPPAGAEPVLKGVWPGIGPDDRVVIWAGGVWDWLDPLTAVRAVETAAEQVEGLRLFFLGTARPPEGDAASFPTMTATAELEREIGERGLEGRLVFLNREWVPYRERGAYLLESDLGISTHKDHLEARYAFRTRVLDYIWAGLPVVATGGDVLGELVERRALGRAVPAADPDAAAAAIVSLLGDRGELEAARARVSELADSLRWSQVVEPLERFCAERDRAPRPRATKRAASRAVRRSRLRKIRHLYDERGAAGIVSEAARKLVRAARRS